MQRMFAWLFVLVAMTVPAAAAAQEPAARGAGAPSEGPAAGRPLAAGEVQQLFDGWVLVQAQDALQLSDDQYGRFVTRLKALQGVRRRHQIARNKILGDLRQLTNPQRGSGDEASIADRLKALRDEDDRAAAELRQAYDAVDETLDTRQQARFRLFEERMEQRKLELLMRARQNVRAGRGK